MAELISIREDRERLAEQQRGLIAFEIHDGLLQYACAAVIHLQCSADLQAGLNEKAKAQLRHAMRLMREVIREGRELMEGLSPCRRNGLVKRIRALLHGWRTSHGPRIAVRADGPGIHLSEAHRLAIFRIVQEGVSNAVRHSGSTRVLVRLRLETDPIEIVVRDWGRGFDPDAAPAGRGLSGVRQRARALDAKVLVKSDATGTILKVRFPRSVSMPDRAPNRKEPSGL